VSLAREGGSKLSSGKHSASSSDISKLSKEELSPKAPFNDPTSLEQLMSFISSRFDGKPPLDNNLSLGQSIIRSLHRDGSNICMFAGNDSNLGHLLIIRSPRS
ncbi:hypothetical protein V8G54_022988, partial [Vigna mungo]